MGISARGSLWFLLVALMATALPAGASALSSGDWSAPPPSVISPQGGLPGSPRDAQVVVDPAGSTVAVWKQVVDSEGIYAAVHSKGPFGTWSPPELVFGPSAVIDPGIDMATAPNGTVTAVWTSSPGPALWQATKPKGSESFGPATQISAPGETGSNPRITFGPKNQALVVWEDTNSPGNSTLEVFIREAGKSFARVKGFTYSGEDLFNAQPAIGPKGEILIVWARSDSAGGQVIQRATRAAGKKAWQGPFDMVSPEAGATSPAVGIEPSGRATVTYSSATVAGGLIQRTRPAGSSSFRPATLISAPGLEIMGSDFAIGPDGTVAVAWTQGFTDTELAASFRYPGMKDFVAPRLIPADGPGTPSVAVGGARQVFVASEVQSGAFLIPFVTMKPWDSNSFEPLRAVDAAPANDLILSDVAAGQDGTAYTVFSRVAEPLGQLEDAAFKTERFGTPGVAWKLNRRKGLLTGTITRPAFRNIRYSISATRGKAAIAGRCRTNYTPQRSKGICKVRLPAKATWKVIVGESQYGIQLPPLKKTIRR